MVQSRRNRRSLRLKGFDYSQDGLYFVTIVTKDRECLLGGIAGEEIKLNDTGRMVTASWEWLGNQYPYVGLDEYIVMPNHLHGIIAIGDSGYRTFETHGRGDSRIAPTDSQVEKRKPLGRLIGAFKTVSTREANLHGGTPGRPLWQRNYYEHVIRNEESFAQIRQYIRDNPAKWALDEENPSTGSP